MQVKKSAELDNSVCSKR